MSPRIAILLPLLLGLATGCTIILDEQPCDTASADDTGSGSGSDSGSGTGDDDTGGGSDDTGGGGTDAKTDWLAVSVGGLHTCGIDTAGELLCWGADSQGQIQVPTGDWVQVSAGYEHTCALDATGSATCWGRGDEDAPAGTFSAISAGGDHSCAISSDNASLACWGRDDAGQSTPPTSDDGYSSVTAGWLHSCAISAFDGAIECWGRDDEGQASPPADTGYVALSAGRDHTCARKDDGTLDCWGDSTAGTIGAFTQPFTDVSAGMDFSCGIRDEGAVLVCLGAEGFATEEAPETGGPWQDVDTHSGAQHACALAEDTEGDGAALSCWGNGELGQLEIPAAD